MDRKIYRVNMTKGTVTTEDVKEEYVVSGGRAITSQIIADEVDPNCHALGPNNKLVMAPGILTGTLAPCSGRISVGTKSPLTGGIKESNSGGTASQKLAKLGIKALILEGQPQDDKLYQLKINKSGIKIEDASDLAGKGNYEIDELMQDKFGDDACVVSIGPGGENKLKVASIAITDPDGHPTRHCGRGGTGAVMGSKGIKTIIIDDEGATGVSIEDEERFKEASKRFAEIILDHPTCGEGLPALGTASLVNVINEAGAFPTRNFTEGRFEDVDKISGETLAEIIEERGGKTTHNCHSSCIIRCSNVYHDEEGNYKTGGFEYETIWAFGANCEINDYDAIAEMDRLCDDIGIDTIDIGCAIGVAMEAGVIEFGDTEGAIDLVEQIREGTGLGRIIGNGAAFTGEAFGVTRVPTVKKQSMPAYDPRAIKGIGVTYATTTMGADHTAGYSVTNNALGIGGDIDPLGHEGQIDTSRELQIATTAVDSTGLCTFVSFAYLDEPEALDKIMEMISAQYGEELDSDDYMELGKNILKVEREFNKEAGLTEADDRLPKFMQKEELPPHNETFDIPDEDLDEVHNY
ncbi:aldehyde ferredoxin oxidoreductase family protein [Halanaerobaculum tunisiense]